MDDVCLLGEHAGNPMFQRWRTLCAQMTWGKEGEAFFETLARHYAEPPRAYHNLNHIGHCLDEFGRLRHLATQAPLIELAIWFHDAVYDSRTKDSEERSAALADASLERLGLDEEDRRAVSRLVLATKHDGACDDANACIITDVDLAILGQPVDVFDRYERQIREEYHWVHERDYARGRVAVLERFLARDHVFSTSEMQARYEAQARENLRRSIARLRSSLTS
jgi:predicted metal-dependent HD superfamily phosphohydrolase